jgi:DNA-binding CsgD family transcriptional regulator
MAMPVLVIGLDAAWRMRMQRLLALRGELDWLGAYAPAQPRRGGQQAPVLLLLDGDDPHVERARRKPQLPAPRRLYFYRQPNVAALHHCITNQAHACLDKHDTPDTVMRAIRAAESGLFVVAPQLLLESLHEGTDQPVPAALPEAPELPGDWPGLTLRQREIVGWAARGLSNKQIARQLGISPETVKTHLHHVFEREGVHGRVALLAAHLHEGEGEIIANVPMHQPPLEAGR